MNTGLLPGLRWGLQVPPVLGIAQRVPTVRVFQTPGAFTWVRPAGCIIVRVVGVGAGGGGRAMRQSGYGVGAGGCGAYGFLWLDVSAAKEIAGAVGAGGTVKTWPAVVGKVA